MVLHRNEMKRDDKERLREGVGIARMIHLMEPNTEKNARMFAEITLDPGHSIGYHQHDSETEYYLILSGKGTVNDNGKDIEVQAGDAMATGNGASHSITNTGTAPLVFHAIVVTY